MDNITEDPLHLLPSDLLHSLMESGDAVISLSPLLQTVDFAKEVRGHIKKLLKGKRRRRGSQVNKENIKGKQHL